MQAQQNLSELHFVNLHFVDKNYHELHSQLLHKHEDVLELFYISHYYLSRLFKAETGLSPMKYVMYRKIGESQNLLMNTDLPIGTISDRMGFLDNCHFSTTFKKYIGLTPT